MRFEIICLFLTLNSHITTSKSDYTYYFSSYHYEFALSTATSNNKKVLISNDDVTIAVDTDSNAYIIDNYKILHFSNDSQFNEINIQTNIIATTNHQYNHNKRSLLWNKWDHTKSKHIKRGRYIGDASKVRTFDDARSLCREYYGDIASIRNDKENAALLSLCKKISGNTEKSCWIGLTQPYYEWENGQYVSWSHWAAQKPENSIDEKCSYISKTDGTWADYPCNRQLYAICEKPLASYHGNYVVVSKQTTKEKAALFCKRRFGSTLASIITGTDAIEAHEACKKVAKAPHGCWIGLSEPFKNWDNGLAVQPIPGKATGSNLDWKDGKIPHNKEIQCAEITRNGYWKGLPCDYERHILCNVHGVDTQQSEMDMEFLEKKAKEKKAKRIAEHEAEVARQKRENTEDANEGRIVSGVGSKKGEVNPSSPIEKQIAALKQILKQQKARLVKEKAKFEGDVSGTGLHKLSGVEAVKSVHMEGMKEVGTHSNDPMQGLRDEIARLQGVDGGQQGGGFGGNAGLRGSGRRGDRMGRVRRENEMAQRSRLAHGGGGNPFGGAFGGSLDGSVGNPYSGKYGQQQQKPMSYGQYSTMMNRMNPLGLPQVSQGQYAQRRRVLDGGDAEERYNVISKCVYYDKEVCIGYDYERDLYMVDVVICSDKKRREKRMDMSMDDMVYTYGSICDMEEGADDDSDDYIQYFSVYEFVFMFDEHIQEKQCGYYDDCSVCMDENDKIIYIIESENEYIINYNNNDEWDGIYSGENNKKCVHLSLGKILCVMENNVSNYRLEMKFATYKLSKN